MLISSNSLFNNITDNNRSSNTTSTRIILTSSKELYEKDIDKDVNYDDERKGVDSILSIIKPFYETDEPYDIYNFKINNDGYIIGTLPLNVKIKENYIENSQIVKKNIIFINKNDYFSLPMSQSKENIKEYYVYFKDYINDLENNIFTNSYFVINLPDNENIKYLPIPSKNIVKKISNFYNEYEIKKTNIYYTNNMSFADILDSDREIVKIMDILSQEELGSITTSSFIVDNGNIDNSLIGYNTRKRTNEVSINSLYGSSILKELSEKYSIDNKISIMLLNKELECSYSFNYDVKQYMEINSFEKINIFINNKNNTYIILQKSDRLDYYIKEDIISYGYINIDSKQYFILKDNGLYIDITTINLQRKNLFGQIVPIIDNIKESVIIWILYNGEGGSLGFDTGDDETNPIEDPDIIVVNNGFEDVFITVNPNEYFNIRLAFPNSMRIIGIEGLTKQITYNYGNHTISGFVLTPIEHTIKFMTTEKILTINIKASQINKYGI
jgi:hypothetical protein